MPIYEYLCEECGKVNEKLQKVYDRPPARCDECGSRKLAKLVSRSAFQLKGGGWYSDLYASKKKEKEKAEVSKDGTSTTPTPSTTATPSTTSAAEAKPGAKAEPVTKAPAPAAPDRADRKEKKEKKEASD